MNKKITLLALALLCSTGFVTSCGGDDDEVAPNEEVQNPEEPQRISLYGKYEGWSKAVVHNVTMRTPNETLTIDDNMDGTVNLTYVSPSWGTATLKSVSVSQTEQGYEFAKPIEVAENDEHTDWIFPDNVDYISMTQKGPQAPDNAQPKNYPFVLDNGTVSKDFKTYEFSFSAYLTLGRAGIYSMTFKNGPMEEDTPVVE